MAVRMFSAIDVGSHEIEMKIFELSRKNGIRQIEDIRHRIDLGTDTYHTGKISSRHLAGMRKILQEFSQIMKNYQVEAYRACGTSAFREMQNASIVVSRLEQVTGIRIEILGNAEQRFLDYKSIAARGGDFNALIENGTAIVDIGGGSVQISLFDNGKLVTTQNIRLGVLRIQDQLDRIGAAPARFEGLVRELFDSRLRIFANLYLQGREIKNLIVVDDYISEIMAKQNARDFLSRQAGLEETPRMLPADQFFFLYDQIKAFGAAETARIFEIPDENVSLLKISSIIVRSILDMTKADTLWIPGVVLCDGIVYDYAEKNRILSVDHDFQKDIIASAHEISRRYNGSEERSRTLEKIALKIFDATEKLHGLSARERLLLQIAAILHDCGKFISMNNLAECAYQIIMSTEIIGISKKEREIIANVVLFNHADFVYYEEQTEIDRETYLVIAKLTAILRAANGLDRSHRRKFSDFKIRMKDGQLFITVDARIDITLEKGLFDRRADFFEEIFAVRPVIRQKKTGGK